MNKKGLLGTIVGIFMMMKQKYAKRSVKNKTLPFMSIVEVIRMEEIIPLSKIFFALSNPKRVKIYQICLKEKMNITEISKRIKQSYKSTLNNLRILEEAGMINKEEKIGKVREMTITSIPFKDGTIKKNVYEELCLSL